MQCTQESSASSSQNLLMVLLLLLLLLLVVVLFVVTAAQPSRRSHDFATWRHHECSLLPHRHGRVRDRQARA
jgi:hypothetical protein